MKLSQYVMVWDIETIPDLDAVRRVQNKQDLDDEATLALLGSKFPKHLFHKIVCIGAIIAERRVDGWAVISKGAPHIGDRAEKDLISSFVERIAELQPTLVTFNGNSFDMPVLRYRALAHRVSAPGLMSLPYFNRYATQSVDLCDVLASFGNARATLHEISRTLGFRGKGSGMDGSDVAEYYRNGRLQEIADYCVEDVTNTYRLWLAHELFCGRISHSEYLQSDAAVA